jgi:vancomycin resistance protein YoaR
MGVEPEILTKVDEAKVMAYVEGLSERFDREPQDAMLKFVEGRVEEFAPARDGIKVSRREAIGYVSGGIEQLLEEEVVEAAVELPVTRTPPKITNEEVNNLGIVERIGRGESFYAHSIPNRVYNVALASERVSGALIAPGEEFSFNKMVGEISAATGYKTAYVISNGRTELGDGGGVCQVSTTVFRAALNAGMPIVERWAHAYRVGYYEQNAKPGLDATIYSPSKDLKFLNDTPGHILVQAIVDEPNRHLIIEIYGTKDGRVALLSPVRVWGESPPPPDLYQDDPTLAAGVVRQVDWSAWGAKTAFDYRVERNGETIYSKTFNSNFRPWQNVYLRGIGETAN